MKKAYVKYLIIAACGLLVAAVVLVAVLVNKNNTADNNSGVGASGGSSIEASVSSVASVPDSSSVSESSQSSEKSSSGSSSQQQSRPAGDQITVPSVENVTFEQAKASLAGLNLSYSSSEAFSDSVERGKVISQSVKGGKSVAKGTEIHIVISKGPEFAKVPNVQGKTLAEANKLFSDAGIKLVTDIKCSNTVQEDVIISQAVAPGSKVKHNSTVSAIVSAGVANTVGNTNSNSNNNGIVAQQGNWIYFSNYKKDSYLYKMKNDGTERQLLLRGSVGNVNVVGEWVYYTDSDWDKNGIFKIKINGTKETKLCSGDYYWMHVADGWIYYSKTNMGDPLYRMRLDGSDNMVVSDDYCWFPNIVGEWLYYMKPEDNKVYKMKTDGTQKSVIYPELEVNSVLIDNGIMFLDSVKQYEYHIVNLETNEIKTFKTGVRNMYPVIFSDGWLYFNNIDYSTGKMTNSIYKMKYDSTKITMIYKTNQPQNSNFYINVIGDWVYFPNQEDNFYLYRMKTNVSNLQKLYK